MKDFIYNFIGKVDVSDYISTLKNHNWEDWTFRQDTYEVHSETKSVPLLVDEFYSSKGDKSKDYKVYKKLLKNIEPIIKKYYGDGEIIRIELVTLPAKSKVKNHKDYGNSLENDPRIHLVIQTNDDVVFTVDGEKKNMKVGELWEINNTKYHSVENNGNTDRVHMIIDFKIVKTALF
jgi:aspartyl/asparaginyl beta-hydroxylase (cupin superfamily)